MENNWEFPKEKDVEKICLRSQGERACRYLTVNKHGHNCIKGTSFGALMDERVSSNLSYAKGDNCEGILGYICDGKLIGKKLAYNKFMPDYRAEGKILEIKTAGGLLVIKVEWDNGDGDYQIANPILLTLGYFGINVIDNLLTINVNYSLGDSLEIYL